MRQRCRRPQSAPASSILLDAPATQSPLAAQALLQGMARAGKPLVAVGQRGHRRLPTDGGASWKQASVPVSSDLTAVFFVDDEHGWAVGHDGVILHTADGGESWELQLYGRTANDLLIAAMERKVAAEPASEDAKKLLAEAQRFKEQGADKPFLDVWFADAQNGYAVGAYNLLVRTADGGKTWESWFDRTDNPKLFNLYAIRPAGGELFIAGEGGPRAEARRRGAAIPRVDRPLQRQLLRHDRRRIRGASPSACAATSTAATTAARRWTKVDAGLPASVVGGDPHRGRDHAARRRGGRVAASTDGGRTFASVALSAAMPLTGIADAGGGKLARRRAARRRGLRDARADPSHPQGRSTMAARHDRNRTDAGGPRSRGLRPQLGQPARAAGVQQPAARW